MRDVFMAAFLGSLLALATYHVAMSTWSKARHRVRFHLARRHAMKLGIKPRNGHLFLGGSCIACRLPEQLADVVPAPPGHP